MDDHEYRLMYEFENDYWWYRGLHDLTRHYVEAHRRESVRAGKAPSLRILDAGCGTGRMLELLTSFGTVEGFDYSAEAVRLCKERGISSVREADLNTWVAPAGAYDVIISSDVICTAGVVDDVAVIRQFHHALEPGGILIMNLPAFMILRRRHDVAVSGKRRYRRRSALADLREAGFTPVRATYRLPLLFLAALAQKVLAEPFMKGPVASDLKPLPTVANEALFGMNRWENRLIAMGIPMPFGSSLFLVARRG